MKQPLIICLFSVVLYVSGSTTANTDTMVLSKNEMIKKSGIYHIMKNMYAGKLAGIFKADKKEHRDETSMQKSNRQFACIWKICSRPLNKERHQNYKKKGKKEMEAMMKNIFKKKLNTSTSKAAHDFLAQSFY